MKGKFYLGRVQKRGDLDGERFIEALIDPTFVKRGQFHYTFTDIQRHGPKKKPKFVYAKLAKYKPDAAIQTVNPTSHQEAQESVENLRETSCPFVYIPEFSGIAYRFTWNQINKDQFEIIFSSLITQKFQNFFVGCHIEPITDLRTFIRRLTRFTRIDKIQASVKPPNPLFGPCWKSLRDYMKRRNLSEVALKEDAKLGYSVETTLIKLASILMEQGELNAGNLEKILKKSDGGIGDAAVLMAVDGYGTAKIHGIEEGKSVILKTKDNQKTILLDREPSPEVLYEAAHEEFSKINEERHLDH